MNVCARLILSAPCSRTLAGSALAQAGRQNARDTGQALDKKHLERGKEQMRLDGLKVDYNRRRDQAAVAKSACRQVLDGLSPRRIESCTDHRYHWSYKKYYGSPT